MKASRRRMLWALAATVPIALIGSGSPRGVRRLHAAWFARGARHQGRIGSDQAGAPSLAVRRLPRIVPLETDRIGPAPELAG